MSFELVKQQVVTDLAAKAKATAQAFIDAVRDQCLSVRNGRQATDNEVLSFLLVCSQHGLNPLLKQIHGFEDRNGKIRPVMGIDGFVKIAHDSKRCKGIEFVEHLDEQNRPVATTCKIHVEGFNVPVAVTEYLVECNRESSPVWKQMPSRMLRHRALCQAARLAFGFSGVELDDEFEQSEVAVTVAKPKYELPQPKPAREAIEDRPLPSPPPPADNAPSSSPQAAAQAANDAPPLEGGGTAAVADDAAIKKSLRDKLLRLVRGKGHDWHTVATPYLQETFGATTSAAMTIDQLQVAVEWAEGLPKKVG